MELFFSIKNESDKPVRMVFHAETMNGLKILGSGVSEEIVLPGQCVCQMHRDKTTVEVFPAEEG